jgi:urease accessory protein
MNLRLLLLGDSALPIGGYSHSWGLEAAIASRRVHDPASLETWVRLWLRHGIGPLDAVLVAACCTAAQRQDWRALIRLNTVLGAAITPPSLRQASRDMGEQLLSLAAAWPWAEASVTRVRAAAAETPPTDQWHHAIAFGTLAAAAGARPVDAVAVYLHQAALGCISAGVRAIPIGHTHGQQVLARLQDEIGDLAEDFAAREAETAGSFSAAHEVFCHEQNRLYTRLFRS